MLKELDRDSSDLDAPVSFLLALVASWRGRLTEADQLVKELIPTVQTPAIQIQILAISILVAQGKQGKQVDDLLKSIPDSVEEKYYYQGIQAMRDRSFREAEQFFTKELERRP